MKKLFIIILIALLSGAVFYFYNKGASAPGGALSSDQAEVRDLFGASAQFEISYLPRGEAGEFIRSETWYYPATGKAISFLAGRIFAAEDFSLPPNLPVTALLPENFTASMDYDKTAAALGVAPALFDFPGLASENANTYISTSAIFTIESGYLTYFKTIGLLEAPEE